MRQPFPDWIRRKWASGEGFSFTKELVKELGLHTVCQSAHCPNMAECWRARTATFMILGNVCSRDCSYCSVRSGRPEPVDGDEPGKIAEAVARMGVRHAVVTSVTRDDLADGGAAQFAETVRAVRAANPETTVEVLTPDFGGDASCVGTVLDAEPEVFGHNVETVERLFGEVRGGRAAYSTSLAVLRAAAGHASRAIVKSGFMVGHGETGEEVARTLSDLLESGCEAVSIGQYLRPTKEQRAVVEYVEPARFEEYEKLAYDLGFSYAIAGPFVRSSYRSEEMMQHGFANRSSSRPGRRVRSRDVMAGEALAAQAGEKAP
ncbi:MAG: lipoyl synthase [Candidatus Hydrogenedentes bacterium]|nr:lipoyl synthase [Candidatus Hydrogenedentota bacterium]